MQKKFPPVWNSCLISAKQNGQPMHSQLALTEHVSLNLAWPCTSMHNKLHMRVYMSFWHRVEGEGGGGGGMNILLFLQHKSWLHARARALRPKKNLSTSTVAWNWNTISLSKKLVGVNKMWAHLKYGSIVFLTAKHPLTFPSVLPFLLPQSKC